MCTEKKTRSHTMRDPKKTQHINLAPSVGTHHSPIHASDQASDLVQSQERRLRPDLGKHKERSHRDQGSSNSNYAPSQTHRKAWSHSNDSHTRHPSHKYGYNLTSSDSSPERSPCRENRPGHKGVVTSQSLKQSYRDKPHKGSRCASKQATGRSHSARHDTGGNSNADLQKQVDELKALLKDITPGRALLKHNTLLPFSERLRHAKMTGGFRMPKFKTFSGFGDPSNHLKSFDSQLSFWASDDEVYARAFPSSLSGQALKWFHKLPSNSIDSWQNVVDLFMDKFGASIVADEDERTLMEIQQKPGKMLRSYATRFEEVATKIPAANEKVPMISFFHG
ncbi:hypothetical protein LIER_14749 [Lithospermum erythrorhizon]|uniref:Retrotransposon gag domain-containing protein n=1 Tax=Lithospermum erythrorhizon TaxID=34254 RepID=A0AAV3Q190_LITER